MKKIFVLVLLLLITVNLLGCTNGSNQGQLNKKRSPEKEQQQIDKNDLAAITNLVEAFGGKLQLVSLQAPKDTVSRNIQKNYSEFVSPELLEKWLGDPGTAPGRLLSSPWPDRIEIQSVDNLWDNAYTVKGVNDKFGVSWQLSHASNQ